MSVASGFDNNFAILLLGMSMTGGLAYGGYRVFKDNPRRVTELLKTKNRVFLEKVDEDETAWNSSWQKYLKAHLKPASATSAPATPPKTKAPKAQEEYDDNDLWGLLKSWKEQGSKKDKAPDSFKDKCESFKDEKLSGTWIKEYEDIEKYCTKVASDEE